MEIINLQQFDFFDGNSGLVEFRAYENTQGLADEIFLEFYDGEYKDKKSTSINFKYNNDTDFDPNNSYSRWTFWKIKFLQYFQK